jgi:hypothetical protein
VIFDVQLSMTKNDRIKRARKAGLAAAAVGASQRNGRLGAPHGHKGGRPGNPEIKRIMEERGVSRQRAHQILISRREHSGRAEPESVLIP